MTIKKSILLIFTILLMSCLVNDGISDTKNQPHYAKSIALDISATSGTVDYLTNYKLTEFDAYAGLT